MHDALYLLWKWRKFIQHSLYEWKMILCSYSLRKQAKPRNAEYFKSVMRLFIVSYSGEYVTKELCCYLFIL